MKTKFKRIGRQSVSVILAVMMMVSTMLVGMVTSNAANEINQQYLYVDISAYSGHTLTSISPYWQLNCTDVNNITLKELLTTNADACTNVSTGIYKFDLSKSNSGSYNYFRSFNVKYDSTSTKQMNVPENNTYNCIKFDSNGNLSWTTYIPSVTVTPYYVAGETSLVNGPDAWKEAQENDEMSYDETTKIYSITYDKKAAGTYKFKIIEGSNTWRGYNDFTTVTGENCEVSDVDGGNHNIQITTKEESNITITLDSTDSTAKKLTISAEPTTQKYTVAVDNNITNGTVTPSATSLAAGKTFTVTATPHENYVLDAITVKTADGNNVPATNESTHTYTMPASNVIVSATFRPKTVTKYSVTYTAPTGEGVVSASIDPTETTLAEGLAAGTAVTVTVEVKDGYTASLDVNGATVSTSTSGNTYTFTFSMPAQAITVAPKVTKSGGTTGTEIQGLYLIYSDSSSNPSDFTNYLNLYRDANNQVYAYFDKPNFETSKTYYFMISNSKGESTSWEYAYDHYNNSKAFANESNKKYLNCGQSDHWLAKAGQPQNVQVFFAKFSVIKEYAATISSVKINLGYYNGTDIVESSTDSSKATTYEVIPTNSGAVEGMPQVFAKDGTIRATYQKYANMADTVLRAENTADLTNYTQEEYYETAYAKVGTKLKIKTTIDDKYKDTYFVKAFSINGYSYGIIDASQAKKQNGVYTCEYTIPEDFEGSRIEITPIYYYIDNTDTVTFYVEGFDETVQEMWGNTVAVQAWYNNGSETAGATEDTKNALGGYPGQPLVYQGGKYSMQIPKYLNGNTKYTVKGITLNNYFWDKIHKENFSNKKDDSEFNCQTYDYDDFYKLSETADVDNIIFDFRYRTTTDNDTDGNKPGDNLNNNSTYNPSELEKLKDYSGNIVNIFGTILSKEWNAEYDSNHLTVISDGYAKIEGIGNYATEWSVYAPDGTYITKINCSSLINESKVDSAYQEAYNDLKAFAKLPVMIAYEKSITSGAQRGTRSDGRWYFSKKAQNISAKVKIEYRADDTSPFAEDTFVEGSNVGVNTKAQAYFTNGGYSGNTTCQGTVDGGNFSVHAQTDADANYYFLGWYLKTSDGGYSFITNESDADFPMTNNETYVARFINTPSGTLTLSHTLLSGSADGKTFIKADIVDSNNIVKASIDETSGNLVIPSSYVTYPSEYKIVATLRTVPYGKDEVEGFFNSEMVPYTNVAAGGKTCEVSITINELFEVINNPDGSVSYKLKKSNIPFYSKIKSNPIDYQITYTYTTRRDGEKSYVIKDKVSGKELEEMWAKNLAANLNKDQLSKEFITRKAPFVSNFGQEITWDITHANINEYTAIVEAKTTPSKVKILALTATGWEKKFNEITYGTLAKEGDDYLYRTDTTDFPAIKEINGNPYAFSFWAIFDKIEDANTFNAAVENYMKDSPDQDMSARLTDITKLPGYTSLIAKSYSKEFNYICYQDYFIVPVYADRFSQSQIIESQASIRLLEYTRNQWTDTEKGVDGNGKVNTGGAKEDYLYTDFALSFDKNQLLIQDSKNNIKVGIAFEIVGTYDAVKGSDLTKYETTSIDAEIIDLIKSKAENGKVGVTHTDKRSVYRYEITNTEISNKNRIEYYLRFKNTEKAQQHVMKVYSYIYDTKADNGAGEIYLSDPVYMNLYDIGSLTYITSNLANASIDSGSAQ